MIKEPPMIGKDKKLNLPKSDKSYMQNTILAQSREYVETADGKLLTKWDAVIARQFDIAMYAESNADATTSAKFLADRILGKAAVVKNDETKPIPKVLFAVNEAALEDISEKAKLAAPEPPEEEPVILVETDDGKEYLV